MGKFRAGDIVYIDGYSTPKEHTVKGFDAKGFVDLGVSKGWGERQLVLVRRPVRVGDKICREDGGGRYLVTEIGEDRWYHPTCSTMFTRASVYVHDDGTHIDPPKKAAERADAAPVSEPQSEEHPAAARWRYNFEVVKLQLERAVGRATQAEVRANRLSDECGALKAENARLTQERQEVLAENAVLRRKLERLEKKR